MKDGEAIPDLSAIVDKVLGASYQQYNCWHLLRYLFREGYGFDLEGDPAVAVAQVQEIWFQGYPGDVLTLTQPWDIWIMRNRGMASAHVGVVVNGHHFVHTRKAIGVCLEPLRRWQARVLQIARLRRLL